jgi:hypothetical protein
MSFLSDVSDPLPEQIRLLAQELDDIKVLLDAFEKSDENKYMKDAAAKIKANAPIMKQLNSDNDYKDDAVKRDLLRKCRNEMKILFDRAKKVMDSHESKVIEMQTAQERFGGKSRRKSKRSDEGRVFPR